jgi:hypothetical protein
MKEFQHQKCPQARENAGKIQRRMPGEQITGAMICSEKRREHFGRWRLGAKSSALKFRLNIESPEITATVLVLTSHPEIEAARRRT